MYLESHNTNYTVNRKKRGSTFDVITLEKLARILQFLHCSKQEETFYTLMKNMSTSPK